MGISNPVSQIILLPTLKLAAPAKSTFRKLAPESHPARTAKFLKTPFSRRGLATCKFIGGDPCEAIWSFPAKPSRSFVRCYPEACDQCQHGDDPQRHRHVTTCILGYHPPTKTPTENASDACGDNSRVDPKQCKCEPRHHCLVYVG